MFVSCSQQLKHGRNPDVHWWVNDEQNVAYSNGISFNLEKEGNAGSLSPEKNLEDIMLSETNQSQILQESTSRRLLEGSQSHR